MTIFSFSRLFIIATTLMSTGIALVASAPAFDETAARNAPHFVIYSDKFVSSVTPSVNRIAGYNVL
jgi:hypothetical protein